MKYTLLILLLTIAAVSNAQPLNGTITVCSTCTYTTLSSAGGIFEAISDPSIGINGNLVIQIGSDLTETGDVALSAYTDVGGPHTITIQPDGPTQRLISGTNHADGLIAILGANRVVIDGRDPGNTTYSYSNRYLTFQNTATDAPTVGIGSDAVSCALRFIKIESANSVSGAVDVSGGSISGSDDLTIEYCDIKDYFDGTTSFPPKYGINSNGGPSINDNGKINNNNIYNFYSPDSDSYGIYIASGNSTTTIQANSFYEENPVSFTGLVSQYSAIRIECHAGNGFQILGNFIGGTQASCAGSALTLNSSSGGYVDAELLDIEDVGSSQQTLVQGNTIKNIAVTNTSNNNGTAQPTLIGISVKGGYADVLNNIIGDASNSLTATFNTTTYTASGLLAGVYLSQDNSTITSTVRNNQTDNLVINSLGAIPSLASEVAGVYVNQATSSTILIKENIIGNLTGTTYMTTNASSTNVLNAVGIDIANASTSITIDRNKIANFSSQGLATSSYARGISATSPASLVITGNLIYNVSSSANNAATSGATAGIYFDNAAAPGFTIAKNTIYNLYNPNAVIVGGIIVGASNATSGVSNNMITLGYNNNSDTDFYGIYNYGTIAGTLQVYANTSFIVGTGATSANTTYSFFRSSSSTTDLKANLLINTRSNMGNHYAIGSTSTTGWSSDYNLLYALTNLGFYGSSNLGFSGWQTATAGDGNSKNADVSGKFLDAQHGDLRIPDDGDVSINTNIVDMGASSAGANPVTDDIDNAHRINIVDIGASEVLLMWLGGTSTAWADPANWSGGIVPSCGGRELVKIATGPTINNQPVVTTSAQFKELVILDGATVTLGTGGTMNQCNTGVSPYSLIVNGSLIAGSQPINLYGDFYQNNSFTAGTGSLNLLGSSTQLIDGDDPLTVNDVTIDGGGNKILNQSLTVNGAITFTNGLINTSSTNLLTLGASGSWTGASNSSYVNGPVAKITTSTTLFYFPVGKSGKYRKAGIEPSNSLTTTFTGEYFSSSATAAYNKNMLAPLQNVSNVEYWIINRSGASGGFVHVTWDGQSGVSSSSSDRALLTVTRFNGSKWEDKGNSLLTDNVTTGDIRSNNVTSFSPFTLGSKTLNNPLPVELVNFRAYTVGAKVKVTWQTYSELNSHYFYLESSTDGEKFAKVSDNIPGYGTTSETHYYTSWDYTPHNGLSYYRLVQVDLDGTETLYNPVAVNVDINALIGISASPNPVATERFNLSLVSFPSNSEVQIQIVDVSGRVASRAVLSTDTKGDGSIEITHQLAKGFYIVKASSYEQSAVTKIIIN